MKKSIEQVKEFNEMLGVNKIKIGFETLKSRQLRIKLLFEELQELALASGTIGTFNAECSNYYDPMIVIKNDTEDYNYVEQLDALIDIEYLTIGGLINGGFENVAEKAFDLVHSNNMTKFITNEEVKMQSCEFRKQIKLIRSFNGINSYFNEYGKLIKPSTFTPVNLNQLFK